MLTLTLRTKNFYNFIDTIIRKGYYVFKGLCTHKRKIKIIP